MQSDFLRPSLNNFDWIELPQKKRPPYKYEGNAWMRILEGDSRLATLRFRKGARIVLRSDQGNISIRVSGADVSGEYIVSGDITMETGSNKISTEQKYQVSGLEHRRLQFQSSGGKSTKIEAQVTTDLKLIGLPVDSLSFAHPVPNNVGDLSYYCSTESGDARLSDLERKFELLAGDCLSLGNPKGIISLFSSSVSSGFELRYEGLVDRINIGPIGFQRNVTPSVLDFFYRSELWKLLFSAVIFIGGLFWGFRRNFLSQHW